MIQDIRVLDVVALTRNSPESSLLRGQVGTVVESLGPDMFEVEFVDKGTVEYCKNFAAFSA